MTDSSAPMPTNTNAPAERLRVAQDAARMRDVLQRHLQPAGGDRYRIDGCRVAFLRRRDGTRGTVEYDVRVVEPGTGRAWDQVVTAVTYGEGRTRRVWEGLRADDSPSAAAGNRPALPRFAFVPDLELLLQVFPFDHRLPGLARVVDGPPPELLPPLLAAFGPGGWRFDIWEAEAVRYRVDQRCTLRLDVRVRRTGSDEVAKRRFYAKVYRDDEEGQRGYEAQRAVHDGATAAGAPVATAAPVVYAPELRTLVQAAVPGTPLHAVLRQKGDPLPAVRAAARAAAAFHRLAVPTLLPPRETAVARLGGAAEVLRSARPDLAAPVSETVAAVSAGLADAPTGPTHADLKTDHFLIDGDRVALIDFDLMVADDPIRDVANLLAHLAKTRRRAARRGETTGAVSTAFVDEYFVHAPSGWEARLPLHRAAASLTKAAALYRGGAPGWWEAVGASVAEAYTAVAGGGTPTA